MRAKTHPLVSLRNWNDHRTAAIADDHHIVLDAYYDWIAGSQDALPHQILFHPFKFYASAAADDTSTFSAVNPIF